MSIPSPAKTLPKSARRIAAWAALLAFPSVCSAADPVAAPDPSRLAGMLATCAECHGAEGASVRPDVPHLDRQDVPYLIESMELLAAGQRPSQVDAHIPASWTVADRSAVARFYSGKTAEREHEAFDPGKAATGRELFLERCESCHENGGRDPDYRGSGSARIAQQRMTYLDRQIKAFIGGQRKILVPVKRETFRGLPISVRGGGVRERLDPIGDPEVEALVHFLASNPLEIKSASRRTRR